MNSYVETLLLLFVICKVTAKPDCNKKPDHILCTKTRSYEQLSSGQSPSTISSITTWMTISGKEDATSTRPNEANPSDSATTTAIALSVSVIIILILLLVAYIFIKRRQIWRYLSKKVSGWIRMAHEPNDTTTITAPVRDLPSRHTERTEKMDSIDLQDTYTYAEVQSEYEDTSIGNSTENKPKSTNTYSHLETNRHSFRDKTYTRATASVKPFIITYSHFNSAHKAASRELPEEDVNTGYNRIGKPGTIEKDVGKIYRDFTYSHQETGQTKPDHLPKEQMDNYSHLDSTSSHFMV